MSTGSDADGLEFANHLLGVIFDDHHVCKFDEEEDE